MVGALSRVGRALAGLLLAAGLAVGLAFGPPGAAAAQEALTPAQKAERVLGHLARFELHDAKLSYGAVSEDKGVLTIRDLTFTLAPPPDAGTPATQGRPGGTVGFSAERLIVRRYDYRNPELPHFADWSFEGVRLAGTLFDDSDRERIRAFLGGREPVLDIAQTHELDPAGAMTLDYAGTVTLRDLMRVDHSMRLDGLDLAKWSDPQFVEKLLQDLGQEGSEDERNALMLDLLSEVRLHRLSLAFTDFGGVDVAMAALAAARPQDDPFRLQLTGEAYRRLLAGELTAGGDDRFGGTFAPAMLGAVAGWLQAPGTLKLALRPQRPLPLTGIAAYVAVYGATAKPGQRLDLDSLQKYLGLDVSYTPAAP